MIKNGVSIVFIVLSCLPGFLYGQKIKRIDNTEISALLLDKKIQDLMQAANVQGLAVSVFNSNRPVYKKAFGYKNFEKKAPLKISTNIYGASLSKAVFAVLVMKLVEEGKLELDKPLQSYLPQPIYQYKPQKKWHDDYRDLKNDSLYSQITARHCLTHSSGFPNWRWFEPDQKIRVLFRPGRRYHYSGEGLVYLQVVLEHLLGKSLEELMQARVFAPAGMTNSAYTWQPGFESDYSFGHDPNGKLYPKDKDNEARAASTLETTLDDYTLFLEALFNHKILTKASTAQMFTRQIEISSVSQFGPSSKRDTNAYESIGLGYALGWGFLQTPAGKAVFKEGHGDGFQHYSIIFPENGTGILIMSNSDNAEIIFKELLEYSIGDIYTPWRWQNYIPYQLLRSVKN